MAEISTRAEKKRKNHNKVRVKLPGIESYEKTLEFTAEGPGRVVVRLERLMGSDKIRITDPKYLATLVERLEAEEAHSWGNRSRLRKKAERNRSRQLAIEGLMEPAEDMQDLYEHPVFRVNRVLNRLALFDQTMSAHGATDNIPPINPVEPFSDDLSGRVFRSYPAHQVFHREILPFNSVNYSRVSHMSRHTLTRGRMDQPESSRHSPSKTPEKPMSQQSSVEKEKGMDPTAVHSTKSLYRSGQSADGSVSRKPTELNVEAKPFNKIDKTESEEEKKEDEYDSKTTTPLQTGKVESMRTFRKRYGVPSDQNLVKDWQIFKSHLVQKVYEESGGSAEELYDLASDVIGTYDRQLETVDDYIIERPDKVRDERRAMGMSSRSGSRVPSISVAEVAEEEFEIPVRKSRHSLSVPKQPWEDDDEEEDGNGEEEEKAEKDAEEEEEEKEDNAEEELEENAEEDVEEVAEADAEQDEDNEEEGANQEE